ncbi:MAG: hypothetical protein N4A37_07250 [Prolixibacteraceae bacterium]|nr:hypothetical protein [Prolixibacteraceae bacterium]
MKMENIFHKWLENTDCIIIPNIGALIVQNEPAKWDAKSHTLEAPFRRISFNNHIQKDNGGLTHLISQELKCSYEQAAFMVQDWSKWCFSELKKGQKIELSELGILSMDGSGYISMKSIVQRGINSGQFFGLEDLYLEQSQKEKRATLSLKKERSINYVNRISWSKITAAASLLFLLCIPRIVPHSSTISSEASLIPTPVATTIEKKETIKEVVKEVQQIQIVAGSFRNKENANKILLQLNNITPSIFHIIVKEGEIFQVCSAQLYHINKARETVSLIHKRDSKISLWLKKIE